MRRTVAEIQKCKPGLCLPQQAENTLSVFTVVDQLQTLLLELEKVSYSFKQMDRQISGPSEPSVLLGLQKVPALFIQQPQTPVQSKVSSRLQGSTDDIEVRQERNFRMSESRCDHTMISCGPLQEEQGQIRIVHFEEDPLRRSGGVLQTVEQSPPPQSRSLKPDSSEVRTSELHFIKLYNSSALQYLCTHRKGHFTCSSLICSNTVMKES